LFCIGVYFKTTIAHVNHLPVLFLLYSDNFGRSIPQPNIWG
jgi:hypothetical protein